MPLYNVSAPNYRKAPSGGGLCVVLLLAVVDARSYSLTALLSDYIKN